MDCPVCGYRSDENVIACERCGTKFSFLEVEEETIDEPVVSINGQSKEE